MKQCDGAGKWEIYIPDSKLMMGMWHHNNDSFRELAMQWKLKKKLMKR